MPHTLVYPQSLLAQHLLSVLKLYNMSCVHENRVILLLLQ